MRHNRADGLPRGRRRHLRGGRSQGPHQEAGPRHYNAGVLSEIGSFGGDVQARPLRGYASPCSSPPPTAWAPRSRSPSLAGRPRHRRPRPRDHCVNDILVQGAVPLFFLDYLAVGKIDVDKVEAIVRGVAARLLARSAARWSAARRREMPDVYAPDDYDLAGFIVGVVDREQGARPAPPCARATCSSGLPSTGLHTNGYTLARKVLFDVMGLRVDTEVPSWAPRWAAPCSRRTAPTSPPSSRCSSGGRSTPSPISPAAASPGTSLASCPTASARACASAPGRCRRSSVSSSKGGRGRRRRDVPHLQHGDRDDRDRRLPKTCTTSSILWSAAESRATSSAPW